MSKKARSKRAFIYRRLQKPLTFIRSRPFTSFLISLGLLFLIIFLGQFLTPKAKEPPKKELVKSVQIYKIGSVPKLTVSAQVEKSGVIKIVAQTSGIISEINIEAGQPVNKGDNLIQLSSNYQGGSTPALQTALAVKQYQIAKDTFDAQKEIIKKQREVAEKNQANAEEMRSIADRALSDTRSLSDLNNQIIDTLNDNLSSFEATNSGDLNRNAILQTRSLLSQFRAGQNQITSSIRNLELQSSSDKSPAQLSQLQKDITLKQLGLQEKSLGLNQEISQLQVALASMGESLMHPVAPFSAVVQRIHVRVGDLVNPGTPLLTLSSNTISNSVVAKLPENIAKKVSVLEPSFVSISGKTLELRPKFVSTEATDGQFYSITYVLPDELNSQLTDGGFVKIEVPVDYPDTGASIPFIPVDSVFQTQDESYLFLAKVGKAKSQKVNLGQVLGSFVEVKAGLSNGDQVILNRNVVDGDKVSIQN